ncbi:hypothetical protein P3T37_002047 [Kitasatospora sp. MAA4]|uniref:NaeI family type II restriction endonuclease n=1 Tax=Kitasatospora sp. MAA4 TaxID=3035093 RepID=UPI0024756943|nr:NaeI family type II restriction endonuclease [Kitasatospora sp. MAA4]MDH6132661.1 hypothetical protein [Kitasatospora sp. MAA4]
MGDRNGGKGRPWGPLRGEDDALNRIAVLLREQLERAGLTLRDLQDRLTPELLNDQPVPSATTLSKRFSGEGLAAAGTLAAAVIGLCAPDEEVAGLLEKAQELFAESRRNRQQKLPEPPSVTQPGMDESTDPPSLMAEQIAALQVELSAERAARYQSEAAVTFLLGYLAGTRAAKPERPAAVLALPEPLPARTAAPSVAPWARSTSPNPIADDEELLHVAGVMHSLDTDGSRFARVIRTAFDKVLDGPLTGRYELRQLGKTEKTYLSTLIEMTVQREFGLADGTAMDYLIDGVEVDLKFSQRGLWMIPPELNGHLTLLLSAWEETSTWSLGICRISSDLPLGRGNRDGNRMLSVRSAREGIHWLHQQAEFPDNALRSVPPHDLEAILQPGASRLRMAELFRRVQGRVLSRNVLETVTMSQDSMRRVRDVRPFLEAEGIAVLGGTPEGVRSARKLWLPVPSYGDHLSVRLTRAGAAHEGAPTLLLGDELWTVARPEDPVEPLPQLS